MLRITIQESSAATTFKLEGKIAGPWVQELEQCWNSAISASTGNSVVVDLAGISFIAPEGKDLLARMSAAGAKLVASGPMTRAVIEEIVKRSAPRALILIACMLLLGSNVLHAQNNAPLRLTLRDAVRMALGQNPQVQIANLNLAQSQQDVLVARSTLLPQAGIHVSGMYQRFNLEAFIGRGFPGSPQHAGPFWTFQAGPNFSVPIFDLTLWRRWQASKEMVGQTAAQEHTVREEIASLVVSQYLGGLRAAADVQAAKSRVQLAQALYDQADDLQKHGVGTGIDTLRANVELQNETQRLIASRTELKTSLYGLSRLLNLDPKKEVELADTVSFFQTPPIQVDQSLDSAFTNRPEMKALQSLQLALGLQKKSAIAEKYPSLRFDGNWGYQGLTPGTSIPAYQLGFSLNFPLFTGGRIGAEVARAELELKKVDQQAQDERNLIALQVKTAAAQLQDARHEVDVANLAVKLANEEVIQARDRFQAGVANNIEVITAQDALARASDNQIVALYRYNQARADLARATGQIENLYAK